MPSFSTFSIADFDSHSRSWGVAVHSKFFAVGTIVPWAEAEVGAVATQARGNPAAAREGLRLLSEGLNAADVIDRLLRNDPDRNFRQFGVIDKEGNAAAHTGSECIPDAGHIVGNRYTCQGNLLFPNTLRAMSEAFEQSRTNANSLAESLAVALSAGQDAGGDRRGQQAAALLVVRAGAGYEGSGDRLIDLRVDDNPNAVSELHRLLRLHELYLQTPSESDFVDYASVAQRLDSVIARYCELGDVDNSEPTRESFIRLLNQENLTHLFDSANDRIDSRLPDFLASLMNRRAEKQSG